MKQLFPDVTKNTLYINSSDIQDIIGRFWCCSTYMSNNLWIYPFFWRLWVWYWDIKEIYLYNKVKATIISLNWFIFSFIVFLILFWVIKTKSPNGKHSMNRVLKRFSIFLGASEGLIGYFSLLIKCILDIFYQELLQHCLMVEKMNFTFRLFG